MREQRPQQRTEMSKHTRKRIPTPAAQARIKAGYATVADLARKLMVSPGYVRKWENHGGAPDGFAVRWGRLVGASPSLVFHHPDYWRRQPQVARQPTQEGKAVGTAPTDSTVPVGEHTTARPRPRADRRHLTLIAGGTKSQPPMEDEQR